MSLDFQDKWFWIVNTKHFAGNLIQRVNNFRTQAKVFGLEHNDFSLCLRIKHFGLPLVRHHTAKGGKGQSSNLWCFGVISTMMPQEEQY